MAIGVPLSLPQISISPAPLEDPAIEITSPFQPSFSSKDNADAYRPMLLTPPPLSPAKRPLSPLRPVDAVVKGAGMERDRFEALLKASRERNAAAGNRKEGGLRKEIALKSHKNKQVERRALFLSKVLAPASADAVHVAKTPPESPAIFHFSLPSPGLVSPLALFETLETPDSGLSTSQWVEQVDFRLPGSQGSAPLVKMPRDRVFQPKQKMPSLAQISARLSAHGRTDVPRRLPSPPTDRPRLATAVGRLTLPVREVKARPEALIIPPSPCSPISPNLEVTTLVVPKTTSVTPIMLSEANLLNHNSREQRSKNMLNTIDRRNKRRSLPSDRVLTGHDLEADRPPMPVFLKRKSAPSDLMKEKAKVWGSKPMYGGF